jgi:hypothetical protein
LIQPAINGQEREVKQKLYKVLVNGGSCHGGDLLWSLPTHDGTAWQPGEWHSVTGPICICKAGLHGTTNPAQWIKRGCRVYRMEAEGIKAWKGDKFVCRRARLLRPVHLPLWWRKTERFITSLESVPWFKPDGNPRPGWKLFLADNWEAAREAADASYVSAGGTAYNSDQTATWGAAAASSAWIAIWNAAATVFCESAPYRYLAHAAAMDAAYMCICDSGLIAPKNIPCMAARWEVWTKGYALLCGLNGQLYVYAKR